MPCSPELKSNIGDHHECAHHGFVAQEVIASGFDFGGLQDHSLNGGNDVLSIGYDELIAPLVKALQEQQEMTEGFRLQISELTSKVL